MLDLSEINVEIEGDRSPQLLACIIYNFLMGLAERRRRAYRFHTSARSWIGFSSRVWLSALFSRTLMAVFTSIMRRMSVDLRAATLHVRPDRSLLIEAYSKDLEAIHEWQRQQNCLSAVMADCSQCHNILSVQNVQNVTAELWQSRSVQASDKPSGPKVT